MYLTARLHIHPLSVSVYTALVPQSRQQSVCLSTGRYVCLSGCLLSVPVYVTQALNKCDATLHDRLPVETIAERC